MITVNYQGATLNQATAVMRELERLAKASATIAEFEVDGYENGREHGFFVKCKATGNAIAFAEYRNTDDIVLYPSKIADFTDCYNLITESIYAAKRFVGYGQYTQAASLAYGWLVHSVVPTLV